jgi:hypothetical protein
VLDWCIQCVCCNPMQRSVLYNSKLSVGNAAFGAGCPWKKVPKLIVLLIVVAWHLHQCQSGDAMPSRAA